MKLQIVSAGNSLADLPALETRNLCPPKYKRKFEPTLF